MKKKSISLIIWLMSIALLGVVAMQYYFIRETYKQKSILFDEAVNTSLAKVAAEIEKTEVIDYAKAQGKVNQIKYQAEQEKQKKLAKQLEIQKKIDVLRRSQYTTYQKYKDAEESLKAGFPNVTEIENWFFETYHRNTQNKKFIDIGVIQEPIEGTPFAQTYVIVRATKTVPRIDSRDDSVRYVVSDINPNTGEVKSYRIATLPPKSSTKVAKEIDDLQKHLDEINKEFLVDAKTVFDTLAAMSGKKAGVVEDVAIGIHLSTKPLEERIDRNNIHKLLREELGSRDIHSPFNMEIRDRFKLIYHTPNIESLQDNNKLTRYTTTLFKGDLGEPTGRLSIYFPNKKKVIFDTMNYLIVPTIALFGLLVGCFGYTLSIIFKQKKMSEMKTDFINNMTHEFKTPVATIMIASESLRDPEISSDNKRVNKLANIIYDENVRLGNHIERVLNIAKLEKENLKIEKEDVYINPLVENVLDSMNLQLTKVNGTLSTNLTALNDIVIGDELHLSNVFFNLVDNAIKYSPNSPEITVKTYNTKSSIVVSVSDKGMGMTKDQQEKIFDQFYRIPTGNIHNVKGFGLGLSYVNDIVKRLDGKIQVKSEKDKGTTFEVTLPLKNA